MKFITKFTFFALIIYVIVTHNQTQVESALNLRKFSVKFYKNKTVKNANKDFKEKILLDQNRNHEAEMEKKRQEIYKKFLLNRVYGPVLKDFYSRF